LLVGRAIGRVGTITNEGKEGLQQRLKRDGNRGEGERPLKHFFSFLRPEDEHLATESALIF
jgi:hypothetical protein